MANLEADVERGEKSKSPDGNDQVDDSSICKPTLQRKWITNGDESLSGHSDNNQNAHKCEPADGRACNVRDEEVINKKTCLSSDVISFLNAQIRK